MGPSPVGHTLSRARLGCLCMFDGAYPGRTSDHRQLRTDHPHIQDDRRHVQSPWDATSLVEDTVHHTTTQVRAREVVLAPR